MTAAVEALLAAVQRLRAVEVEIDDAHQSAAIRARARLVAHIDLGHDRVVVDAPAEMMPTLERFFPSGQPTATGIAFDLADPRGGAEALEAIRRRASVERFVPQFRDASP